MSSICAPLSSGVNESILILKINTDFIHILQRDMKQIAIHTEYGKYLSKREKIQF